MTRRRAGAPKSASTSGASPSLPLRTAPRWPSTATTSMFRHLTLHRTSTATPTASTIRSSASGLSRMDVRIQEQTLINQYDLPNLYNRNNSIAPFYWEHYRKAMRVYTKIGDVFRVPGCPAEGVRAGCRGARKNFER